MNTSEQPANECGRSTLAGLIVIDAEFLDKRQELSLLVLFVTKLETLADLSQNIDPLSCSILHFVSHVAVIAVAKSLKDRYQLGCVLHTSYILGKVGQLIDEHSEDSVIESEKL